jgi:hypothetical protein
MGDLATSRITEQLSLKNGSFIVTGSARLALPGIAKKNAALWISIRAC